MRAGSQWRGKRPCRTVLCLSDDPSCLLLYRSLLELDGQVVLLAGAAKEGIELVKNHAVDCVVLDHTGDGALIAKKIRQCQQRPPVVYVVDRSDMLFEIYPDVDMFITRNEAIEELCRCINEVLDRGELKGAETDAIELNGGAYSDSLALNRKFVRWFLPW